MIKDAFSLKPLQTAKVSEISEKTANSDLPPEDRINFHIGNPIQDENLYLNYISLVLGISVASVNDLESLLREAEWEPQAIKNAIFLCDAVKNTVAYMPAGGYNVKSPNEFIKKVYTYFNNDSHDPIEYDFEKREVSISTGGLFEALRVFLYALNKFVENQPVHLLFWKFAVPDHLKLIGKMKYTFNYSEDSVFLKELEEMSAELNHPLFLFLGDIPDEETRRNIRRLALKYPIFIIEINNASNAESLARESQLADKVLRLLTPGLISPLLDKSSVVLVLGNSNYIKIFETMHFQLLGTPSAAEIWYANYVWENASEYKSPNETVNVPTDLLSEKFIEKIEKFQYLSDKYSEKLKNISENIYNKSFSAVSGKTDYDTESNYEIIRSLLTASRNNSDYKNKFLSSFIKHHPEYEAGKTLVVSGSARSALSLLGFHCGIKEIIIPDLSWTYEHCFEKTIVVPLKEGLKLDDIAIIKSVENKLSADPGWKNYGAVVINNPHNASGVLFPERKIKNLVINLFRMGVRIIDDLSYQNVAPCENWVEFKTIKQVVNGLIKTGDLSDEMKKLLITVHSLSKTDCFAGARLCVVNIPDEKLFKHYKQITDLIKPNLGSIIIAYLFYKNDEELVTGYWNHRNRLFSERMNSIINAFNSLSKERNFYNIQIYPPTGSMYPRLEIKDLPDGLSLDWLSSNLASQGVGMVPLSTFARSGEGYKLARKTYRLTLGGTDGPEKLYFKSRRLLIDLNRLISEEESKNTLNKINKIGSINDNLISEKWVNLLNRINNSVNLNLKKQSTEYNPVYTNNKDEITETIHRRLQSFYQRYYDKNLLNFLSEQQIKKNGITAGLTRVKNEFSKDSTERREKVFYSRQYDRTVHPTQIYSLQMEILFESIIDKLYRNETITNKTIETLAVQLIKECLGENIAVKSAEESEELLLDLEKVTDAENYINFSEDKQFENILSFWGDWDGSTRPSGQGHRLVASVVINNIEKMAKIINGLRKKELIRIEKELSVQLDSLKQEIINFWKLLNEITNLTHQLEKRYQSLLPYSVNISKTRRLIQKLRIIKDPVFTQFEHNDNFEKKMLELRKKRKQKLEYYFALNKKLRKIIAEFLEKADSILYNQIHDIVSFRCLLNRFILTPRIHQKLITSKDQFAIDTTVFNIIEINEIGAKFGNPALILAIQISMSDNPDAFIHLERKLRSRRNEVLRENPGLELPNIKIIPLFEDIESVENIIDYLDAVWTYCIQSRNINQSADERFCEIFSEVFIAGSDLSQQVSQPRSAVLYNEVKFKVVKWLGEKGIVNKVRMKLGSGEPMQRQGGYYNSFSGEKAFLLNNENLERLRLHLKESTIKSTEYAVTPLLGIFSSGDLRTLQSNVCEQLRYVSVEERATILYHMKISQQNHMNDLVRVSEPLTKTRLNYKNRGYKELYRLTVGDKNKIYDEFVKLNTENFRNILYGNNDDLVGIHLISYFISRTTPTLRDRPILRPSKDTSLNQGHKVLENIAKTIPMNRQGTTLRAISHNHAQTLILGYNQLTTGLGRTITEFIHQASSESHGKKLVAEIIMPNLPVYEILRSLKYYHDFNLEFLNKIEPAFQAGNSSLLKLREDNDAIHNYMGMFRKELLRRQGIPIYEFFEGDRFIPELLPTLRSDLGFLMIDDDCDFAEIFEIFPKTVHCENWYKEILNYQVIPKRIKTCRNNIWELLTKPVFNQVKSFVELAVALKTLTKNYDQKEIKISSALSNQIKLNQDISKLLNGKIDDTMKLFFQSALKYLTSIPENNNSIPVDIIRAIKDVESILTLEKQALGEKNIKLYNYYALQIARAGGDNG